MAGILKEGEGLSLDNLETALVKDNKVKLAGIDIDGEHSKFQAVYTPADTPRRHPPRQTRLEEKVPLCRQRWLWILFGGVRLGYA